MMGEQTTIVLPGRLHRETEFVGGLHGACGPNAASMAERWADQSQLTTLDVYHRMHAAGRCGANGETTLRALALDARDAGYHVDTLAYREPMPAAEWRGFFAQHVGRQAIVFETANGQTLRDAISGQGENARNLHYHFVMVAGWHAGGYSALARRSLSAGWWCCDGDNFARGDVLQFYPDATLAAAQPCAAMAVYGRVRMGGTNVIPTGWSDDGTTLTAPNGVVVVQGFRDVVLAQAWDADNWPLAPERGLASVEPGNPAIGAGTRQEFRKGALGWTAARGAYQIWIGQDVLPLSARVADLEARLEAALGAPPSAAAEKALAAIHALAAALV